jgi:ribosomal protein S1
VADFGVFVEIEPGIPGLLHVANCPGRTTDNFEVGQALKLRIDEIVLETRGFKVSLVEGAR